MSPSYNLFGPKLIKKLRFSKDFQFQTPTVGNVIDYHAFRLNSLYDPDYATGGHQPMGFDQIMPHYNHYTVLGAKVTVRAINTAGGQTGQGLIIGGWIAADPNDHWDNINHFKEAGGSVKWRQMANRESGGSKAFLSWKYSAKKYFGSGVMQREDLRATETTNPAEGSYLIVAYSTPWTTTAQIIQATVTIDYIAAFTEPKKLDQS